MKRLLGLLLSLFCAVALALLPVAREAIIAVKPVGLTRESIDFGLWFAGAILLLLLPFGVAAVLSDD